MRCLLTRCCLCSPDRTKREDPDGDGHSLHGGELVELSDGLSPKARGKQSIAAASRLSSSRSTSDDASLPDAPVKSVAIKLSRRSADRPFGMTINGPRNRVTEVLPGSPAAAGGVRVFDVVLKINGVALGDERLSAVLQGKLAARLGLGLGSGLGSGLG